MSTYTDLHTRRRETLTILRQPGSIDDGLTPQRVIFANPENIYEGTFKGRIDAVDVKLSAVTLTDATINNGIINDASIYSDGRVVKVSELTADIAEISGKVDGAIEEISSTVMDALSGEVNNKLNSLSNDINKRIDTRLSTLSGEFDSKLEDMHTDLVDEISSVSTVLSNALLSEKDQREHADSILQDEILDLSIQFDGHVSSFNQFSADMSSAFDEHVQDNIETFDFLSNFMLSSLEHDRHYTIYGTNGETTRSIPYQVKEFAVNIIRTGTTDVQIVFGEDGVVGYGTYLDESLSSIEVTIDATNSPTLKEHVFSWPYTYTVKLTNNGIRKPITGEKEYTIAWIDSEVEGNRILLEPYGTSQSILKYAGETIGLVKEPCIDGSGFLSGTLLVDKRGHDSRFDVFADAFRNYEFDRSLVDTPQYNMELSCGIGLKPDLSTLVFMKDVETRNVTELVDLNGHRFGFVRSTGLQKDGSGRITALTAEGIDLEYKDHQDIQNVSAVLDSSNRFAAQIGSKTWISCDIEHGNVFTVSDVEDMYYYNFYTQDDLEQTPSGCRGFIVPDLVNKTILDNDSFTNLSVMTDFVDSDGAIRWQETYLLNKIGDGIWEYTEGSLADRTRDYIDIRVQKIGNSYRLFIDFIDADTGFELVGKQYTVKATKPEKYVYGSTQTTVLQSTSTDFTFDVEEFVAGETYYVTMLPPNPIEQQTLQLDIYPLASKAFKIKVPTKDQKYNNISREFIVATKVVSNEDFIEVELIKDGGDKADIVSPGHQKFVVPTKVWTAFKVIEVMQDKFLIEDLDDVLIRHRFDKVERDLSAEISARQEADTALSNAISSNKSEIDDLWKNIRGGLNYIDNLSIGNFGCETIYDYLIWNSQKGVKVPEKLREGFFYVIQTPDKSVHYSIEGLEVEHGDWLIFKNSTPLSSTAISDVAIFDAQDYDNFKLSGDNTVAGNNIFNGKTDFVGGTTAVELSVDSLHSTNAAAQTVAVKNASISSAVVADLSTASLSAELEDFYYGHGLSSLRELTASLQSQMTSAQLSIDHMSAYLEEELSSVMHYFGTLSSGYGQTTELTSFLHDNFNADNYQFGKGYQYRISTDITIKSHTGEVLLNLYANDYIQFNQNVTLSDAEVGNIDIIRDAQAEGEQLQKQIDQVSADLSGLSSTFYQTSSAIARSIDGLSTSISGLSSELQQTSSYIVSALQLSAINPLSSLSNELCMVSSEIVEDIQYLSSELSDYHSTLSGIDRLADSTHDIPSDNLIVTDANMQQGEHSHNQYYMTFLSGTIVFKPIAK